MKFRGITYTTVPLEACKGIGEALHAAGTAWHFHVLSPVCLHNPYPGRFALVIEAEGQPPRLADAGDRFPAVDEDLVKLLHGADILDRNKARGAASAAHSSWLLGQVLAQQDEGRDWHHHMHFPDCVFNPHPGAWSISVESADRLIAEAFPDEPVDVLREVELIYFANLGDAAGQ